ncbi:hypothetical protein [Bradyrhizobium japonicum]|uniref:hypothetical protein n=1 Tax=Bradyrhizobium japonicum TaxID=375 RepID=UPI0004269815|nr:hypothetical protein [Bradyrhizobium japonicum]
MSEIVPTIGRIVLYRLCDNDVISIHKQRGRAFAGNEPRAGAVLPAMIVAVWGSTPDACVNLKVMLDGEDTLWATSRNRGDGEGQWHWMPYQLGQAAKTEAAEAAARAATAPQTRDA